MDSPLLKAAVENPPAGAAAFATKLAPPAAVIADLTSTPQQSDGNAKELGKPGRTEERKVAKLVGVNSGISSNSEGSAVTDLERKLRRAERFGVQVVLSEKEKRNSRAERFGIGSNITGSKIPGQAEEEKRKARAERFGLKVDNPIDEAAKKKARLERFAPNPKLNTSEEEKKKARAIRFSQDSSEVSGEANCDLKAKTEQPT
ncbi:protein MODIFIER OF SNC1 11-like isoform X1 [Zingiber officinale]|uniref:protein MODIFIER OF SNC1 11-like isoform X1 n=1 Tax=Zingiber officinale TaxID=94328 RepID=UPI001C4AA4AC|nr:protein MODIFIER OF SNC1 11-like isoform X1 [Zingiber officinale]